jgi:hypothetical protein
LYRAIFSPIVSHEIHKKVEKILENIGELGLKIPNVNLMGLKKNIEEVYAEEEPAVILSHLKENH